MTQARTQGPAPAAAPPTGKAIILFADGTGNAFAKQESNVWRLYEALDKRGAAQIAYYIPGVGTSGFRPWATVDAATGLGVPSNVRRLYEYLCWNYEPGDRVYVFGFSRGAFTARALIGMISTEGLLSRTGQHGIATRPEMRRNVMSAWRAYRASRRRSWWSEAPTIKLTRALRDGLLWLRDHIERCEPYAVVKRRADATARVRFLGLFDTVEAYGVPLEEMRDVIDWAIWPIRFRTRTLSDKVDKARHALSLDDERQTFHPVRFDRTSEADRDRIDEVWFAGVHSDVGGGYPDDAAALVPLCWMLHQLDGELAFEPGTAAAVEGAASSLAAIHDSRAGLGTLYRYYPRLIGTGAEDGGPPVVHHSVVEKMVFGPTRYAPHALPATLRVLMPDGRRPLLRGFAQDAAAPPRKAAHAPGIAPPTAGEIAERALAALLPPDEAYVRAVHDAVWLRRKVYFVMLAGLLLFASLPWTGSLLAGAPHSATRETLPRTVKVVTNGIVEVSNGVVTTSNDLLAGFVQDIAAATSDAIPSYLQRWVKAVVAQPFVALVVLGLTLVTYAANGRLKDRIDDDARCAWFGSGRKGRSTPKGGLFLWGAGLLRRHVPTFGRRGPLYWAWCFGTLVAFVVGTVLAIDRVALTLNISRGAVCTFDKQQQPRLVELGTPQTAEGFAVSNPCWDTGLFLDEGRAYALTLEMAEPFLDRTVVTGVAGFADGSPQHWLGTPFKRWLSAPYFQPIARIGASGMTEFALRPDSGEETPEVGMEVSAAPAPDRCAPVRADPKEVTTIMQKEGLQPSQTSRFVAPASGELFIYLNDAIVSSDALASLLLIDGKDCFYRNNSGTAKITVERLSADRE